MPYTNILIPFDGSSDAILACESALNLKEGQTGRIIHLVYCIEPVASLIGGEKREEVQDKRQDEAEEIFATIKPMIAEKNVACKTYIVEGKPGMEISRLVDETGSEIVIMGTRGSGRLKNLILGSVSTDVVKRVTVPVLLANSPH